MAHQNTHQATAIEMLKAEHRQVKQLFQQYERAKSRLTKQAIAAQACATLEMHTYLEETIFYPVFEYAADTAEAIYVEEAFQEHQAVKDLLEELEDTANAEFDAIFRALRTRIEAHMQDEEQRMFPKAEEILAEHMEKLTEAMRRCKQQLIAS